MKTETGLAGAKKEFGLTLAGCLMLLLLIAGVARAQADWPHVAFSKDGTPISYEIQGSGEPTLVFVHGWSCDSRYWRAQLPYFSGNHRVVTLDLAGHGHSGTARTKYTMGAFGEDVRAVVEATGGAGVILIGHSMGGSVIAEAARLMPDRVAGLIGVDTLENIEYPVTREELEKMFAPLEKDFRTGSRQFAGEMISSRTDPPLREWILSDMSAAPPAVALSAMNEMMSQYMTGEAAKIFDKIRVPVMSVNGDLWPVNYEANRRHMFSFDAIVLKDADHFLMMDRTDEFNRALEEAIHRLSGERAGKEAAGPSSSGSSAGKHGGALPEGFVYVDSLIPNIIVDLRYYSEHNFVGERIDGYVKPRCILTEAAAKALLQVQEELKPFGLGLKIFDAYRPKQAVDHFVRWAGNLEDTRTKSEFYPGINKNTLIRDGYIAGRSSHSRGSTVDLTIVSIHPETGKEELDMATGFDFFGPASNPFFLGHTSSQRAHRMLLNVLMKRHGFEFYPEEWWHFTLKEEPFPETYFNFPVQ